MLSTGTQVAFTPNACNAKRLQLNVMLLKRPALLHGRQRLISLSHCELPDPVREHTDSKLMNNAEQAAYLVAHQQKERMVKADIRKLFVCNFLKGSLNAVGVALIALIALGLTLIFWPAAVVFLLFCIAVN
tara:strand:+ start:252 stop:644 length:393 start_codon:yes stop_codon:yes gene_type:complete